MIDTFLTLLKRSVRATLTWIGAHVFLVIAIMAARLARRRNRPEKPRLVWGSTPLINNSYWTQAMRRAGCESETFVTNVYALYRREDFDRVLSEEFTWAPVSWKPYLAFIDSLFRYDVFLLACDGYFLGWTPVAHWQARLLRWAGKKIVMLPYGSDAYVYRRIRNVGVLHGLLMSYPAAARDQQRISRNVDYWCANADVVISGIMGPDGFGRWDVPMASGLFIDLDSWKPSTRRSMADGRSGSVTITHAPNHRGFKGTEFVIEAIRLLKEEGFQVELRLLEGIPNTEVRRILNEESDILVEQIISTGAGLNGLEGMASGLPVVCNLEDDAVLMLMRRWSYFGECPLVSASPETLVAVLRQLITRPQLRHELGQASRTYAKKYHGLDSAEYLFTNVIDFAYGRRDSLINLYHPLLGEYPRRSPKVEHPLVNNRIVDA